MTAPFLACERVVTHTRAPQILAEREQLPVRRFEDEIMAAVDNNPVVIIRGATGCGKTTQVPQYILDRFIKGGRASDCNIVVTQVTLRQQSGAAVVSVLKVHNGDGT